MWWVNVTIIRTTAVKPITDPVSEHDQQVTTNRITPHHRRSCLRTQLLCVHKQNHNTSQKILSHNTITMCPQTESQHITEDPVS